MMADEELVEQTRQGKREAEKRTISSPVAHSISYLLALGEFA